MHTSKWIRLRVDVKWLGSTMRFPLREKKKWKTSRNIAQHVLQWTHCRNVPRLDCYMMRVTSDEQCECVWVWNWHRLISFKWWIWNGKNTNKLSWTNIKRESRPNIALETNRVWKNWERASTGREKNPSLPMPNERTGLCLRIFQCVT